jgi:DNA-directed RNA polymerase specialized sigma24 family protein
MTLSRSKHIVGAEAYATAADFEQIFTDDMSGLYLLSFLLAGDPDEAETVFTAGIEESTRGKRVFKEWARSWARRSIIQSAIRILGPQQNSPNVAPTPAVARAIEKLPLALQAEASAIIELAPLERFVLVMSVLERYSDHDCSILLGFARKDLDAARARALQQLGASMSFQKNGPDAMQYSALQENPRPLVELTIARYFATQTWSSSLSQDAPLWP